MQNRVGEQPVWLSTAGMGVAWLHVRLDDRPKYYGYSPYRDRHWQTQHCS
jgi:NADH:ubiquinone oxidoreductase subunit